MTQPEFSPDHFALFGLERRFGLDTDRLERAYKDVQATIHPDRYAHLPEAQRRLAMQRAAQVNEAYCTLRKPLARAQYLLHLHGIDVRQDSNTAMSPEFLMEQMEWREAVAEARAAQDAGELESLLHRLRRHGQNMVFDVERELDDKRDFAAAADVTRRLMFVEKLQHDIDEALMALEG